MPKASIIIPVYNKEKYLKETLKSVDKQTVKDLEIIIVDDKSTDCSMDIITDFKSSTEKQVKVIQNDKNMGVSYSRNIGIEESKSDYITFLDADDLLNKNFIKVMLTKMKKYPDLDFVRGRLNTLYDTDDIDDVEHRIVSSDDLVNLESQPNYIDSETYSANSRLYKKDFIKNLRFFESPFEDLEFVLNVLASSKQVLYTYQTQYHYRMIKSGRYSTNVRTVSNFLEYFDIWERFEKKNSCINPDILECLWNWFVNICGYAISSNVHDCVRGEDFYQFRERYYSCLNYYHKLKGFYRRFIKYSIYTTRELEKQKQKLKEIAMKY